MGHHPLGAGWRHELQRAGEHLLETVSVQGVDETAQRPELGVHDLSGHADGIGD